MSPRYERNFYVELGERAHRSAAAVLDVVFDYVQPQSVADVGCGSGEWLAAFRQHGVEDLLGVDGPWVDHDLLQIQPEQFRVEDLTKPLLCERRFDLAVSLEVAEHLPPEAAETFVESLTRLGSVVLFSAAIPYQGGTRHLNERWPSYWAGLFAARGFRAIDCLRGRLWSNRAVEFFYAQNMYFAVDEAGLRRWPALAEAARHQPPSLPDLVHPRLFLQDTAYAKSPVELFQGTLGAIRDRWLIRRRSDAARQRALAGRWPP